ncbi:MAG: hypothetical protein EAZ65_06990 [Verrucomicrobia bacterium]|nr:MAG: hypothetical protein EAZ84_07310 [Verrucomicrobiota bacterium]TAE87353.1 MAG: hypothetical protein EAZ82_07970 [Verrucomicrobiota bacterium]TAF25208.1 MAG: hypothetical protein EAZ71_08195 [Verrucomicrobiota bacterium]TAF40854.1 MAG: hypothetical protein EAZ65_06990 [Verrucomicrobiota bacterium]
MRPEKVLPLLLGAAIGAAGLLQGLHWRSTAPATHLEDAEGKVIALENEVALLKRENESLRSLAQGGGEVHVDPALIEFVEQSLGMDFKSNPQVHRIASEELRDRIIAAIEARYGPHGLDSRQQAWSLMGLLGPDDRFAPQLAATKAIGARSWFDDQSGEGWVTDRFDPQAVPDQAALIRALARILIHQNHATAPGWPGDEVAIAREALHHGAAMAIENRFLARQALATGFTGLQENSEARELLANLPTFIRGLATFPSTLGLPRAERLIDQEEILSALHRPPSLSADFFPEHEGLTAQPPHLPDTPGNTVLEESLGMLGLKLWLDPLGEDFSKLANGWRGDRYRLHALNDHDVRLLWDIRFDSPDSADAFATAAAELIALLAESIETDPGTPPAIPSDRQTLRLSRPAPDLVRLTRGGL